MNRRSRSHWNVKPALSFELLEKRQLLHGGVVEMGLDHEMMHETSEMAHEMEVVSHLHGETVEADAEATPTLDLSLQTRGTEAVVTFGLTQFELSEDNVDGEHVDGQGHLHLYVDGEKISRVYGDSFQLAELSPGNHIISADLNSNDHRAYTRDGQKIEASIYVFIPNNTVSNSDSSLSNYESRDVVIGGLDAGDAGASSVHTAGDFNGDGIDDVIIGAPGGDNSGNSESGEAYIVYGSAAGLPETLDLSTLNGVNGFKLVGVSAGGLAGTSVGGGGDVNDDGFDDVVIGAPGVAAEGAAYVVFGSNSFGATFNLANLNGANGFQIVGAAAGDDAGRSVALANDVNDDGFDDAIVGAPLHDSGGENAGAGYVIYGAANGFSSIIDLGTLPIASGIRIYGAEAGDNFGYSVETAGDVNGDLVGDVVFGAPTGFGDGVTTSCDGANTVGLIQCAPTAAPGYTLFSPNPATGTYLVDENGFLVNSWSASNRPGLSAYLLDDGSLLRTANTGGANFQAGGNGGAVEIYDWAGNLTWQYAYSNAQHRLHHDVEILPNGNVLMIAWQLKSSAEAIAAGRDPSLLADGRLWPDHIIEVQPTGASSGDIVWQWNAWDHLVQDFDVTKDNFGNVADNPQLIDINYTRNGGEDWMHTNSVDYNPALDQILISVHGFSEIWVIDHSTTTAEAASHSGGDSGMGGDLLYRWGNAEAYDRGTPADREFYTQHDAQWIEPGMPGAGNILVFNNGQQRPGGNASSVDEIVTPVDANGSYTLVGNNAYGPADPVWTWMDSPATDFYAQNISGAHRLSNGNTLITNGPLGQFLEVDAAGNEVFEYINPVNNSGAVAQGTNITQNAVFRAIKYDPGFAGFVGKDLTPGSTVETGGSTSSMLVVEQGAAYVLFGSNGLASLNASSLNGSNGFKLTGVGLGDQFGYSVGAAGDVNGDGFSDVVFGAPRAKVDGVSIGAGYVVFGKSSGFPAETSVQALDGTNGFRLSGEYESDPILSSLFVNATGVTGYNNAVVNFDSVIPDDNYVHIHTSGIPHYTTIGPWAGNPNNATDQDVTFYIPRNPEVNTGTKTPTRLGAIGAWVDGTAIFNWSDGRSYLDQGNWNQMAIVFEGSSFDECDAHPPGTGQYHTHGAPTCLISELIDDGTEHSPILGWSFDGFPIYGSYGYVNGDPAAGVARVESSWSMRNISTRVNGPSLSDEALGSYREDFEHIAGSGDLDQHNGRFSVTPEYPEGIYHYYVTIDAVGDPAFPYSIGLEYNGVVAPGNVNNGGIPPTLGSSAISVGTAGDMNVDGFSGVVVGDPKAHVHGVGIAGSVTVVHGHSTIAADVRLHDIDDTNGLRLFGEAIGDQFGAAVGAAGDVNGDGGDDLIFGAPGSDFDGLNSGQAFLAFSSVPSAPLGRYVFYNQSDFDGAGNSGAIALDKSVLLPGQTATFANYTSYLHGINGLMVDLENADGAAIGASDFEFSFGNVDDVDTWATITLNVLVSVETGAGIGGSDRVVLEFDNGSVINGWLQVRILANANSGLANDDIFYIGNAVGETGDNAGNAIVNLIDVGRTRVNQTGFGGTDILNVFDFNRDARVNLLDVGIGRVNQSGFTPLRLITPTSSSNRASFEGDENENGVDGLPIGKSFGESEVRIGDSFEVLKNIFYSKEGDPAKVRPVVLTRTIENEIRQPSLVFNGKVDISALEHKTFGIDLRDSDRHVQSERVEADESSTLGKVESMADVDSIFESELLLSL